MGLSNNELKLRKEFPLGTRVEIQSILGNSEYKGLRGVVNGYTENCGIFIGLVKHNSVVAHPFSGDVILKK